MIGLASLESHLNPITTPAKISFIFSNLSSIHKPTTWLSFFTLALLLVFRYTKRHFQKTHRWVFFIPEIFLIVVASTVASRTWRWDKYGIPILGDVSLPKGDRLWEFPLSKDNMVWFKKTTPTAM